MNPTIAPVKTSNLIPGIDSIRFFAAFWVALSHGASFPFQDYLSKSHGIISLVAVGLSKMVFNGIDAVVVFFLISGFCIHLPNIGKQRIDIQSFLLRRLVRISIPLLFLLFLRRYIPCVQAIDAVVWSVYCEITYYAIYPILFVLSKKYSWTKLLLASSVISLFVAITHHSALFLWQLGVLTWLFCLPFWLGGIFLAIKIHGQSQIWKNNLPALLRTRSTIWFWRTGAVIHCIIAAAFCFHLKHTVGLVWTVPPFAVYSYFWLQREVSILNLHVVKLFEIFGSFSYSVYLTHAIIIKYFENNLQSMNHIFYWGLQLITIFSIAYIFHVIVERPSHNMARWLGSREMNLQVLLKPLIVMNGQPTRSLT